VIRLDRVSEATVEARRTALRSAVDMGAEVLAAGGEALDAVTAVVIALEECPHFNAGRGAVLATHGGHELDAAVMCSSRAAGSVACVRTTRNPIRLARLVMEDTEHVMLIGAAADALAAAAGLEQVDNHWFTTPERSAQLVRARSRNQVELDHGGRSGTVGAVARDTSGRLAAATSTGGMTNKAAGRVGDSPIIGAGTWADSRCAISATGHGEHFMRRAVAVRIAHRMELLGETLDIAARAVLDELPAGVGGVIGVDAAGHLALPFTSRGMYRGWASSTADRGVAIY
jgi:beta-aspartyl-peptidase (threonine type)